MTENYFKLAKKYIKNKPMPCSLKQEFENHALGYLLEGIYHRTAELLKENKYASPALQRHLQQILPCIAFYEALVEKAGSKENALEIYAAWCFGKIEKMAKWIPRIMKIPGLYKKVPDIMRGMLDKLFGHAAGFDYVEVECENGFAVNMTVCPYVETCKKYGCPELVQYFCKSDDIIYGNMHKKLVWGRTKTLGTGGDCCDFSMWIKEK